MRPSLSADAPAPSLAAREALEVAAPPRLADRTGDLEQGLRRSLSGVLPLQSVERCGNFVRKLAVWSRTLRYQELRARVWTLLTHLGPKRSKLFCIEARLVWPR